MNIADLTAKIKVVLEKDDLNKLSESLEHVKNKIQELNKKLKDLTEEQKKEGEQTKKVAEQTEEAAKETEKQAESTEKLADKTKKTTSEMHGFLGVLGRIVSFMKQLAIAGTAGGVVLERMYEKAGKLGASLRLISTDFSLRPEELQRWRMLAEQAGLSFDTMDRMLSVATEMKRLAVINPNFLPRSLNLAGIRPANYKDPESLLKAILQASLSPSFKNDQARMAWLQDAGFSDPASAYLLAQQYAKGLKFDSAYFISDKNAEKLKDVHVAISKINRLSESVKNNFLATISDDFVEQINDICNYIIKTVHAIENFITKHGGFRKILSDFGGLSSKISKVANAFASMAKFMMSLGLFTSLVVGFGVALGGVLKIADMLVERCATALNLAGSIKEFIAGYIAVSIGDLINTGNLPKEYVGIAKDIQGELLNKAGIYKDPAQVAKGVNSILSWLKDVGSKLGYTLLDGLVKVLYKAIDYLVDAILRLWVKMDLPFAGRARRVLVENAFRVPEENRTEWQKNLISQHLGWAEQDVARKYDLENISVDPISGLRELFGRKKEIDAERRRIRASRMLLDAKDLLRGGLTGEELPILAAILDRMNILGVQKDADPYRRDRIVELQQTFNLKPDDNINTIAEKIRSSTKDGVNDAFNLQYASGIGGQ